MRSSRTRSLVVSAVVLALAALGWIFLAPTQIGGSTRYMITHGISMEPMLHTGDLVVVRPASNYRVGEVVAYKSTLLHTVVLHRIRAIHDGHYTLKGDNNNFIDPTHPTRSLLVGAMWLHIPGGGTVLNWIHKPGVAAALTGGVAVLLLFGGEQKRRRRRRRGGQPAARSKTPVLGPSPVTGRHLLTASAVAAVLFAGLGVYSFVQPSMNTTTTAVPYTQQVSFGYRAHVHPGPAYPSGVVTTGDPLYAPLVHHLRVTAAYRLSSTTSYRLRGSVRLRGTMANTSGWSRSFWLGPATQITAGRAVATAKVSLPRLNSLITKVSTQIGLSAGTYTLAIRPRLSLTGEVDGQPLPAAGQPTLSLALGGPQLLSGTSSSTSTGGPTSSSVLVHTTNGDVTTARTAVDKLGPVSMKTVRLIGIAGFALFALMALLLGSRERGATPDPVERINSRYKHLIVPVAEIHTDPEHPPIEVRTIEALAQLAERSERLILHDHQENVDSYLIDDQGTLFRFQALRVRDINGNGNGNGTSPHGASKVAAGVAAAAGEAAVGETSSSERNATSAGGILAPEPGLDARTASAAAVEEKARTSYVDEFAPLSDPTESAEAIRLSSKVTPVAQGPQARRPPVPNYAHWSQRPEVRIGFTLAPLLTLLAMRRVRARRADSRPVEADDRAFTPDRGRTSGSWHPQWDRHPQWGDPGEPHPPERGQGDRRRGDRRRNY